MQQKLNTMELNQTLLFGILLLFVSCNENNEKTNPEPELSKIILELKELGGFENAEYEFPGEPNKKISNQKTIKITFTKTDLKNLNVDEFGKNSAKKIYNLNTKTRNLETVWITVEYAGKGKSTNMEIDSNTGLTLSMNVDKRNLVYQAGKLI
jgi:hypothetical protein